AFPGHEVRAAASSRARPGHLAGRAGSGGGGGGSRPRPGRGGGPGGAGAALRAGAPVIPPELGDNPAFALELQSGDPDGAFAGADHVYRDTFWMGRHTGVTLEPRAILADLDPTERRLPGYHSFQAPNMMQDILARHLNLLEHDIRVICKHVGGSFGIKVHIYPDEM